MSAAELAALRRKIDEDRAELTRTLSALAAKTDVRSRLTRRVDATRAHVEETGHRAIELLSRPAVARPAIVAMCLVAGLAVAVLIRQELRGSRRGR